MDLLVVGALGHKGIKNVKNLTKGMEYLVSNCKIPTLVMKSYIPLEKKLKKSNNWLICIKDDTDRSFKGFDICKNMINRKTDTIIGIHFSNDNFLKDNVNRCFEARCKENRIKNKIFVVRKLDESQSLGKNVLEYLIFGKEIIEYVVINNNVQKYTDISKSPTVELLKYGKHNIIFCK